MIQGEETVLAAVCEALSSWQFWVFLAPNTSAADRLGEIERRFYAGKRSKGFLLFIGMWDSGPIGIALCDKRWLSPKQLAAKLNGWNPDVAIHDEQLYERDMMSLGGTLEEQADLLLTLDIKRKSYGLVIKSD